MQGKIQVMPPSGVRTTLNICNLFKSLILLKNMLYYLNKLHSFPSFQIQQLVYNRHLINFRTSI